jgi:hypothetical protein
VIVLVQALRSRPHGELRGLGKRSGGRSQGACAEQGEVDGGRTCACSSDMPQRQARVGWDSSMFGASGHAHLLRTFGALVSPLRFTAAPRLLASDRVVPLACSATWPTSTPSPGAASLPLASDLCTGGRFSALGRSLVACLPSTAQRWPPWLPGPAQSG